MFEEYSLLNLYNYRKDLYINNMDYRPEELNKRLKQIDNVINSRPNGSKLLENLNDISSIQTSNKFDTSLSSEEKKEKFEKILDKVKYCEKILNLKNNALLYIEEIVYKNYLEFIGNFIRIDLNIKSK
tara:strand:+ start:12060 stop:12443 length:384 start_codon:yes stop_codon:yes gene_type:complete